MSRAECPVAKNHGVSFHRLSPGQTHAAHLSGIKQQIGHMRLEMDLCARSDDGLAHVSHQLRQHVGPQMRVRVHADVRGCPKGDEKIENAVHIAALFGAGVQLAVGIGARPAFAEAVVGMRVDQSFGVDLLDILEPGANIASALQQHGLDAGLEEGQGRKISARSGPDHNHALIAERLGRKY